MISKIKNEQFFIFLNIEDKAYTVRYDLIFNFFYK